jgi:DNA-binding transcriptional MerR regulator
MLISEFARVTGLTRDTVRFYARLGPIHKLMTEVTTEISTTLSP